MYFYITYITILHYIKLYNNIKLLHYFTLFIQLNILGCKILSYFTAMSHSGDILSYVLLWELNNLIISLLSNLIIVLIILCISSCIVIYNTNKTILHYECNITYCIMSLDNILRHMRQQLYVKIIIHFIYETYHIII